MPASRQARATVTSPRLTRSRTPLRRCARLSAGATTFFLLSTLTSMESGCAWPLFLAEGLECLPSTWALRPRLAAHGRDRFSSTHRGRPACVPRLPGELSVLRREGRPALGHARAPRRAAESALCRDGQVSEVRGDLRGHLPRRGLASA